MPWFSELVGEPFINWLRKAADEQYAPQVKGDPFATSMRDFDDVAPNLRSISNGVPVHRQRMTDLRAAKLVTQDSDTLSELGVAVLNAWTTYGVADAIYEHELPRHLVVVCEALIRNEPFYIGLEDFWKTKASLYGADMLVENWGGLFVQTYFSKTLDSYCPMNHVGQPNTFPTWNSGEIRSKIASMVVPSDRSLVGLEKIINTLDASISRGKARKIFIIALCLAVEPTVNYAQSKLSQWTLPLTTTSTQANHALLPQNVIQVCVGILQAYAPQLLGRNANSGRPEHLELLLKRKNVILFGPPGTGKTFGAYQIADFWKGKHGASSVISTTFHPTYSYEDFVWGWRPDINNSEHFVGQDGTLLDACSIASSGTPTLLFIDEINRADTARVFGELITYIEADKRERPFRIAQDSKNDRVIPSNLYILGTMNTADRSVSLLDVALRRRFAFVEYAPNPLTFSTNPNWIDIIGSVNIKNLMVGINIRLADAGVESDRAIGHALFSVNRNSTSALDELRDRIQYDIYPLVVDYCFSDRSRVSQVLGDLVSSDGRFNTLDDAQFIAALNGISG